MITIKNMKVKKENNEVTLNWNEREKTAKCSCGNEWVPVDVNDNRCMCKDYY